MSPKDREIQRKLKILKHAEETGHVGRTCRYFGIGFLLSSLSSLISPGSENVGQFTSRWLKSLFRETSSPISCG